MTKELFSCFSKMFVLWYGVWLGMLAIQCFRYCDTVSGNPAESGTRHEVPRFRRLDGVMFPTTALGGMAIQGVYSASYSASTALATEYGGASQIVPVTPGARSAMATPVPGTFPGASLVQSSSSIPASTAETSENQPVGNMQGVTEAPLGTPVLCPDLSLGDLLVIANRLKEGNVTTRQAAIQFLQGDAEFRNCSVSSIASIVGDFGEATGQEVNTPRDAGTQEWCKLQPAHPLCRH
ncbi:conserved hypothetical protein [Neospora caninum Liverpool]|uniref:Uncharacterized protein n=1 Tax=Neospora caninum (strain Liverpool) TaxID=572307 RepID=F0VRF9_NEOCL|nr:conserved hypothetical protein [Neospora caninum Liverpool]CBZ56307.1 conserved hypothetical protein [Neospora caninum Liverpool]|eukprot:XP_003886332.1 conserved hypothetical protein [Neospora caninum Liverpool]